MGFAKAVLNVSTRIYSRLHYAGGGVAPATCAVLVHSLVRQVFNPVATSHIRRHNRLSCLVEVDLPASVGVDVHHQLLELLSVQRDAHLFQQRLLEGAQSKE